MNSKNKILAIIIICLLLANTIFTSILWFRTNQPPAPPNRPDSNPEQFLIKKLGFDSIQQATYQKLHAAHFAQMKNLREKEHLAKDSLFNLFLLSADTVSEATVLLYANHAAEILRNIDTAVYNHFKRIKDLCTPEQKEKLAAVIHELRMNGSQNRFRPEQTNGPADSAASENMEMKRSGSYPQDDFPKGPPPPNNDYHKRRGENPPPPDLNSLLEQDGPPPPPGDRPHHRPPHPPHQDGPENDMP